MSVTGEAAAASALRAEFPKRRWWACAVAIFVGLLTTGPADAVVRSCGSDPVANTAEVLCASPSGPCDASTVHVSSNIKILDDAFCIFELGGQALIVSRTIEGHEQGFLFRNAGDVLVTSSGKIKTRGDFVKPFGFIAGGGDILMTSSGAIVIEGVLDVSGDAAGNIDLSADDDVTIARSARILGRGISSFLDEGARFADGGTIEILAGGDIVIDGELIATSQSQATGGEICLDARGDVMVSRAIDVSGGDGDGGRLEIFAGDHVRIEASVDADSVAGGGSGGEIVVLAGADGPGHREPGGGVTITDARLTLRGHGVDDFGGDGGEVDVTALGDIILSDVVLRADASPNFDANGGIFFFDSISSPFDVIDELDGDVVIDAVISANGSRGDGDGGELGVESGRNLTLRGSATLLGADGGTVDLSAGGDILMAAPILAHATSAQGIGGGATMEAGFASLGTLRIARNVVTSFGPLATVGGIPVDYRACRLVVDEGVKIAHGSGLPGSSATIRLASRQPMELRAGSRFLGTPGGKVEILHPAGADPVIGPGVVFDPPATEIVEPLPFPSCPDSVCGNGIVGSPEQCEDGNLVDGDGCSRFCRLGCTEAPRLGCRRELVPGRGRLAMEIPRRLTGRERLHWSWAKGEATTVADFGDPTADDTYVLCVYGESGVTSTPIMQAVALADTRCGSGPCWRRAHSGYSYRNVRREPDGIGAIYLLAGGDEDAYAAVVGKGAHLELPPLPLALPLRVQLQQLDGECWESTFSTATKNDERRFEAASD